MKKFWFPLFLLSLSGNLFAQVKFNLSYQAATQTYTVSVVPETTYPEPKNTLGSAQVVVRAKFSSGFTPAITSLVDGVVWADNSYIDFPVESPEYTFVCIALVNGPTRKIILSEGKEVPLFSFKNAGGDCPGMLELMPNDDPMVQTIRAASYNVTQHFGVLGARGNAFSGILEGAAECTLSGTHNLNDQLVEDVQISPIPADKRVTLRWQNSSEISQRMEMVVTDSRSREIYREKMTGSKGESTVNVDVSSWAAGVYYVRFQFDNGRQTRGWHFMVMR
jgi:hypothetical protein